MNKILIYCAFSGLNLIISPHYQATAIHSLDYRSTTDNDNMDKKYAIHILHIFHNVMH